MKGSNQNPGVSTLAEQFPAVVFGTSGVRALVSDLSDAAVAAYVLAFLARLRTTGRAAGKGPVVLATDLRPSSPAIALAACRAAREAGYAVEYLGAVPTPAMALRCMQTAAPGVMVTGSHIPFDRNGIKFYAPEGEILKEDEVAIAGWCGGPDDYCAPLSIESLPAVNEAAKKAYRQRYVGHFGKMALRGMRVGLYEHSAVGRDLTHEILAGMGATVVPLGRSDDFVPVDTEAVGEADTARARDWCQAHVLDALVSTDGDGDRPLVFDERGDFVRGDLLGLVCAEKMRVRALAVPVSCNTAIEKCGVFECILRTRIGSPYVIAGMHELAAQGYDGIAGFEANGGFLLGTSMAGLDALPTRDALLPIIALLAASVREGKPVSALIEALPARSTHSDRIKAVPNVASAALLKRLTDAPVALSHFFSDVGTVAGIDTTDGLRVTFANGDIVHLRQSGNAPELRCYAEAGDLNRAKTLVEHYLLAAWQAIA